ncbi:MAG TPA: sulfate adenylyltransferase, partial [Acidimicrobiales bacterium]|nr:sulfate adenylyltransferase [Acidimicrobiales bacterium]
LDYRGYAGSLAGGILEVGDDVTVLPSGRKTRIEAIETADGALEAAFPPMSVVVRLTDHVDVSRGDMIVSTDGEPTISQNISATICWMAENPVRSGSRLELKHTTRWTKAIVDEVRYRIDVNSLQRIRGTEELGLNDLGRVDLRLSSPLFFDDYRQNRATGSIILVDGATGATVAAGMLVGHSA